MKKLKEKEYAIREIRKEELGLLKDFLYEAIFIPEGTEPPDRGIIEKPELRLYIEECGSRKGDHCLAADFDGRVVGVVWTRIMDDYGHVDDDTPSLAISLEKEYRGRGIGTQLMVKMLEFLKELGYKQVSLSVQKANCAVRMYQRVGFRAVEEKEQEYIMLCELETMDQRKRRRQLWKKGSHTVDWIVKHVMHTLPQRRMIKPCVKKPRNYGQS